LQTPSQWLWAEPYSLPRQPGGEGKGRGKKGKERVGERKERRGKGEGKRKGHTSTSFPPL